MRAINRVVYELNFYKEKKSRYCFQTLKYLFNLYITLL